MELRHLRYLVAVADAATFSGAAQQVGVAQPALTRQLHELERELGAELFVSRARKATLTPAGEAAVQVARHVRDEVTLAVQRARLAQAGLAGRCVVCVSRGLMMDGLPARLLKLAQAKCPGITIEIAEGDLIGLWNAVANSTADIGLGQEPPLRYQSLAAEVQALGTVDHAVVAEDHPLASRTTLRLEELFPYPFVWIDTKDDSKHVYSVLRDEVVRRGFPAGRLRGVAEIENILVLTRAEHGWSAIPGRIVPALMRGLVAIPLEDFAAPFRAVRMWRRADDRPVTNTVIDLLRTLEREERVESARETEESDKGDGTFVPPRLELRHLRSFVRVVEAGSVGKAAEELGVTQPALSRQMRDLEHDVGVPLLERETRGARPTVAGTSLYDDAHALLSAADGLQANIQRAERGASGRCIVGAGPMPWVQDLVAYAVRYCTSNYSSMDVAVSDYPWPKQPEALKTSKIDVGVGHGPHGSRPMEGIRRVVLISNPIDTALVSSRHPLANRGSVRLEELGTTPFLFVSRAFSSLIFDRVMTAFAHEGFSPRIDASYDGLNTIWALTAAGLGWCVAGHSLREAPPPGTVALALEGFSIPWDVELLYRRDEARAPVLAVIDAIKMRAAAYSGATAPRDFRLSQGDTSKAAIS